MTNIGQRRMAVIVGVTKYASANINDLRFSNNDARELSRVLVEHCHFCRDDVHLFCDDDDYPQKPIRSDILHTTKSICESALPDDLVLFYFAGHGNELDGKPYLLTNDTRLTVIADTSLPVGLLNDYVAQSKALCKLRIFDACRSSFGERGLDLREMKEGFSRALLAPCGGAAILSACSTGEAAHEDSELGKGHGVFTYHLVKGLEGIAADAAGNVTLLELANYAQKGVQTWSSGRGFSQTPQFACDISGPLVLSHKTQEKPQAVAASKSPDYFSLNTFLEQHVDALPADVRRATFTTSGSMTQSLNSIIDTFKARATHFAGTHLKLGNDHQGGLDSLDGELLQWTRELIKQKNLSPERSNDQPATRLVFDSDVASVPSFVMTLGVVRFSFFYWICFNCTVSIPSALTACKIQTRFIRDLVTLTPEAYSDPHKVEKVIDRFLELAARQIKEWAQELTTYLDSRFERLRSDEVIY